MVSFTTRNYTQPKCIVIFSVLIDTQTIKINYESD